jgi:tripeptidyl-peptidase-2
MIWAGVDPGAVGLQTTSDGRPKIIDVIDCTGAGDVETTDVRELTEGVAVKDSTIKGLSGRTLKLGDWSIPSRKIHVGMKRAYEIFPGPLVKRIKEDRKEAFSRSHRQSVTDAQRKIAEWEAAHKSPTDVEKREKKDLETVLEALNEVLEQYADPGMCGLCIHCSRTHAQ